MECNGVLLTKYEYHEDSTPWHYHENPYFMFVLHGNMADTNKKNQHLLTTGGLMFTNWQEAHYGSKHSEKAAGFHVELERDWLDKYDLKVTDIEGSLHVKNPLIKSLMTKIYLETNINDPQSQLSIEALLLDVFGKMKKSQLMTNSNKPNWVKKMQEIILDAEMDHTLSSLSRELNIHPVHLSRSFHKHVGSTLGQYMRQLKLNKAIELMATRKYTMTEVCYQCGFYDQSHFISSFKSTYKMTPSHFIQLVYSC